MEHIPLAFITELIYPPLVLSSQALKEIYMEISGPYGFTSLRLLPGGQGARMQTDRRRECSVLRDKIIYKDEMTEQVFSAYNEQVMTLSRTLREKLRIPVFITQSTILRFLFPVSRGQRSDEFIRDSLTGIPSGSMDVFERPAGSVGLRLIFPPTQEDRCEFVVRIEPYFRDLSMIFAENAARFFNPLQDVAQIGENLISSHAFLCDRVPRFIQEAMEGGKEEM